MKKLILIDASGLIYRGFYAVPPFFKSPSGALTNAVFGFSSILLTIIAQQKPDFIAVAFDKKGPTFRHKEFAEYKATRVKTPQELYDQIPLVRNLIEALDTPIFEASGFEADDVIATVAWQTRNDKNLETLIASGDFDVFQVVDGVGGVLYPAKGFKDAEILRRDQIYAKYGIYPEQVPDFKGLAGDSSDNLPGVRGIGEKTAVSLLQKYGTLERIYEHITELAPALQKKLSSNNESAFLSRKLATLDVHAPIEWNIERCRLENFNIKKLRQMFIELGFKSLIKRLDEITAGFTKSGQGALF